MTTYIGQPADQYRFTHPHPQDVSFPPLAPPAVLPAERANFDSELPHIPPKEIAYSDDNDSLQRDCPNQIRLWWDKVLLVSKLYMQYSKKGGL